MAAHISEPYGCTVCLHSQNMTECLSAAGLPAWDFVSSIAPTMVFTKCMAHGKADIVLPEALTFTGYCFLCILPVGQPQT